MQAESGASVVRALETVLTSESPENRRELVRGAAPGFVGAARDRAHGIAAACTGWTIGRVRSRVRQAAGSSR